jgi:hypothetical protein
MTNPESNADGGVFYTLLAITCVAKRILLLIVVLLAAATSLSALHSTHDVVDAQQHCSA